MNLTLALQRSCSKGKNGSQLQDVMFKYKVIGSKCYRTFKDGNQRSSLPCLIREIDLQKLSKGAALNIFSEMVTPLSWCESTSLVRVLHQECGSDNNEGQQLHHLEGDKLYITTELFIDSVQSLVSDQTQQNAEYLKFIVA